MTFETDLAAEIERAVPQLPAAPATDYLASGRRARRRRRVYAGVAGAAVLAVIGGAALSVVDDPASSTRNEAPAASGPSAPVAGIPAWAQEYGSHGPISIYPSGKLWVAPDARVIKKVEIPASAYPDEVLSAYAAEAEFEGEVWWSYVVRSSHALDDRPFGFMEQADDWTTDFDLWVDYISADDQGRTRFSERLVRFADGTSEQLVARPGAQIVDQRDDVVLPSTFQTHPRTSVAEVTYGGKTWFVIAEGPRSGAPFYMPYQDEVVSASDIDGFLDYLQASEGE
jgi:hypothetical protein